MTDLIDRQAAIEALARMMPRSYTPDGSHPADEEIFRAQEVIADCIEALEILPPAQPATNCSKIPNSSDDTISRQAAIDIERNATVDTNPSHFEAHQKFTQFMDDAEISSFGRWQWSNGFNTALTAVGIDLKKLPSAQPERKRGKWIPFDIPWYRCSECGAERENTVFMEYFCPNCGADMRGEQNG